MTTYIHPSSEVHQDARIGDGSFVWNNVQIREKTQIGKGCILGKGVYVDVDVHIGDRCKIQNGVSLYAGVTLEDEVFVGPNATFTNDLFPRATSRDWAIVPTLLRRGCSIGANATIVCGVVVGAYAMVAAGSVLSTNAPPFALMMGNPARLVGFVCKRGHKMEQLNSMEEHLRLKCPSCGQELTFAADVKLGDEDYSPVPV